MKTVTSQTVEATASKRNEYQKQKQVKLLGSRVRPVSRADKLTTIFELVSQPYRPATIVTWITLLLLSLKLQRKA
jgi:hypothetical protein